MNYNLYSFEELASTNDTASDPKYTHGDIIQADFQTLGRGQRGNHWHSHKGENLMFSLVLNPEKIRVREQYRLSMMAAVAVQKAVSSYGVEGVEIKWPNDIMVRGEKISGILIEHSSMGEYLARTIIGVGVNVLQREFSSEAGVPTSIVNQGVESVEVRDVLQRICEQISEIWQSDNFEEVHDYYCNNLYRREGYFPYSDCASGERFEARIASVNPDTGMLTLEERSGKSREYYFKEVSYR